MEQIIIGVLAFTIGVILCSVFWKLKIDVKNSEIKNILEQKEQINNNSINLKETFANIASDALAKETSVSFINPISERIISVLIVSKSFRGLISELT